MPNGKLTLKEFQSATEATRQFYIWERLEVVYNNRHDIENLKGWRKQIIGAMVVLNVIVLPLAFILFNRLVD